MKRNTYSVHELAALSGCTVRTLHHYDELGLVVPCREANNYRRYGQQELDRLFQVLLYRECDMSLADIKRLLDSPDKDVSGMLMAHLTCLEARKKRLEGLIARVCAMLSYDKGVEMMTDEEKFEVFKQNLVDQNEKSYGKEVRCRWGDEAADASNRKIKDMTDKQFKQMQDIEDELKKEIVKGISKGGPSGKHGQQAADLHRQWLGFYCQEGVYTPQAHAGLADMYVCDQRFKEYYDSIAPGAAQFLHDAIIVYAAK